jgi:hypothetical protein
MYTYISIHAYIHKLYTYVYACRYIIGEASLYDDDDDGGNDNDGNDDDGNDDDGNDDNDDEDNDNDNNDDGENGSDNNDERDLDQRFIFLNNYNNCDYKTKQVNT